MLVKDPVKLALLLFPFHSWNNWNWDEAPYIANVTIGCPKSLCRDERVCGQYLRHSAFYSYNLRQKSSIILATSETVKQWKFANWFILVLFILSYLLLMPNTNK